MKPCADVALMIHSLAGGGAERSCLNLCREFAARGLAVDLVLCRAEGAYLPDVPEEVRIVNCASASTLRWTQALARYMRGSPAPVLLAFMEGAGLVAAAARMLSGAQIRLVVSARNMVSIHQSAQKGMRQQLLFPIAVRTMVRLADGFIGISEGVSQDFARYLDIDPDRVVTIHNPVVRDRIFELACEPPSHFWLRETQGLRSRTIVSAGRLTAQKGFDTLLRAFAKSDPTGQDLRLIILGEGEDRQALESLAADLGIAERVSFSGFVENPFSVYANADLFVMSSRWEGFGNVLAEALACGCPVVSTDCPSGPAEILEDGAWGPLVPVDDPEDLSRAMLQTLADPLPSERLRSRGEAFSVSRSADAYLRVLGISAQ